MTVYLHRLYDKVVASPVRLRLLPQADGMPDVTVAWSEKVHHGVSGKGLLEWHRTDDGYLLDAPSSRIVVEVDAAGSHLTVHRNAREVDLADYGLPSLPPAVRGTRRLAADTLVTNAFTALPVLWGRVAIHSATLRTEAGVVMLCARTGGGKSTLAQHLSLGGMDLLDDDSASLEVTGDRLAIVPMGARARIREDAAAVLGVQGEALPGYAGGKQALSAASDVTSWRRLAASFHLVQLPPDADRQPVEVKRLEPSQALVTLSRSMYVVDRADASARSLRVRTAALLAQTPAFAVIYRRDVVTPLEVATAMTAVM